MTLPDKRRADVLAPATSQNVLPDRSNDTDLALEAQVAAPYSTLPGRRLPAYGRSVLTMREQGLAPAVAVLVVDGWAPISNPNEYAPWIVIVPDGEPATGFDFRCVAGLIALVIAERFERADEIAVEVLKSAPAGLYVWGDDVQATAFYLHELEAQQ